MATNWWQVAKNAKANPGLAWDNAVNRFKEGVSSDTNPNSTTAIGHGIVNFFEPQSTHAMDTQVGGHNYSLKAKRNTDGSVGYDYYVDGQPITRDQYAGAGLNLSSDESKAAIDLLSSEKQSGSTSTTNISPTNSTTVNEAAGPISGNIYNLKDPNQLNAYEGEKNQWVEDQFNSYMTKWGTEKQRAKQDNESAQTALDTSKSRFNGDANTAGSWANEMQGLDTAYNTRNNNINNTFAKLSGNVYQSAQGDNLAESKGLYGEAQSAANQQKDDIQTNWNNTQTAINRAAEDLTQNDIDNTNYYKNWRTQNLASNKIEKDTASNAIANNTKAASSAPTYLDKILDLSGYVSKLAQNNLPSSATSSLTGAAASNLGLGTSGINTTNLYQDMIRLGDTNTSADEKESIISKYDPQATK